MKSFVFSFLLAVLLTGPFCVSGVQAQKAISGSTAVASIPKAKSPATKSVMTEIHSELAAKQQNLVKRARSWMAEANRFVIPSKHKPRVEKMSDGTYRATYSIRREYMEAERHAASGNLYEVSKEKHGYSGTFRFVEVVYESVGATREECVSGRFQPKVRRARAQIFRHTGKGWQ